MDDEKLVCFLVAPFGDKHEQMGGKGIAHFELIRSVIKEIVESFPDRQIEMKRADEIVEVGSVQETFIGALHKADVVVADLSAIGNANVYFELGIRFALRRGITIPIWQKGTVLPADLRGLLGIEYEPANPLTDRETFHNFIRQRLGGQLIDSPVYRVLPTLQIVEAAEIANLRAQVEELETRLHQTVLDESVRMVCREAEDLFSRGDLKAALEKFKIAYNYAPRNLELAIRYGQLLSRAKRHDEAIGILGSAVGLAEATEGPRYITYREFGMAYSRAGKTQLAVDWLQKAVREDPSDSDTHGIIGGVYKQKLDLDKSIEAYERGFDADEGSTYCLLNIIGLLLARAQTGDKVKVKRLLPQANELTRTAVKAEGANHWALFDRGHYLLFAGESVTAKDAFREALKDTKTIGELESARKNLDLLRDCEVQLSGLDVILQLFDERASTLSM